MVPMRRLIAVAGGLAALVLGLAVSWNAPVEAQVTSAPATAPGPQRTERIEAELVPMSAWATPGSTAIIAVRQQIEPGWHTYWRNPGDSGGPTTLNWTTPQGLVPGDIVWPLPERQRLQTLMNYGYSGEVFLPVPIEIPASAIAGTTLALSVEALFMVCSDQMCVPDELTLRLDLPVRDGEAPPTPDLGPRIQAALESAPRPAAVEARIRLADGVLSLHATGEVVAGARSAYFFPFQPGLIDHAAVQTGARGEHGLSLNLTPGGAIRAGGLTGPVSGVLATDVGAFEIVAEPGPALPGTSGGGALVEAPEGGAGEWRWTTVLQAALFALLGGLILNLMPCVFPILAMKAASLARSAHAPAEARRDGLAFAAGVLSTFLLLASLLLALRAGGQAIGWGFQLQSPAVIAGLALLMLTVGLNLSGVFDVGTSLQNAGSGRLSRLPGGAGAFFTGVLAVVVAAPCTAPFMAFALGAALVMPWPPALAIFLMLGLGLALPYVAVSLSPGLLARAPRPGPWMERLKGALAFPMYGTALWLVWVFSRQTGAAGLALLLAAALLTALALWLEGVRQQARAAGRRGGLALIFALSAGLAALAATVAAARAPVVEPSESRTALPSGPWSPAAVEAALAEGRPVLVNFTADWCVTCKINEGAALSSARTAGALAEANAVYLVGDWTRRDAAIAAELERHGRSGVPLYLVYAPGRAEPRILPQLLTEGLIAEALKTASAATD